MEEMEILRTYSSDSVNVLEQHTEFRKPVYSLDHCSSGEQPDGKDAEFRDWKRVRILLWTHRSTQILA